MPARPLQTNFTAGEVSHQLDARIDYARYKNGAERIKNGIVRTTGGVPRRAGTYFISEVEDSTTLAILVPFVYSVTQAYALEFQAGTIRIYQNRRILIGQGDGSELVTNGTFLTDLAGWTVTNTGTGTTVWNALTTARLNAGAAGTTRLGQAITTVVGTQYIVEFDVSVDTLTMQIGTSDGAVDTLAAAAYAVGHHKLLVTATGTASWLQFLTTENADHDIDTVKWQVAEPLTIATSYTAADLRDLRFEQIGDVLYIWHRNYVPKKLLRLSAIEWEIRTVNYSPAPTGVVKRFPNATLTPGATTGLGVTFTASVPIFFPTEIAKIIQIGAGRATIVSVLGTTQVTADIIDDFSSTVEVAAGEWSLLGSPYSNLTPGGAAPIGLRIQLNASVDSWRSTDVGSSVAINGGLVQIYAVASTVNALGEIRRELTGVGAAAAGAWQLEDPLWSSVFGYPEVGALHEGRMVVARDDTFWGSEPGDFENFALGTAEDAAYEYTVASPQAHRMRGLISAKALLLFTLAEEFSAEGVTDAPISPTTAPKVSSGSIYGSAFTPAPLRVGHTALFAQRGARVVRELAFSFEADGYVAPDLSVVAEHLFHQSGILQFARLTTPQSVVFAIREDGVLLACAYERPEQVVAWSRLITGPAQDLTDGQFESVIVIPNQCGTGDEVWVAVKRTINGATKRYIEVFDGAITVDSGLAYSGPPADTLQGLGHLTGETVQIVADGVDSEQVVVGGAIVLDTPAAEIQAGLGSIYRVKTLRAEVETAAGTSQFREKHANQVFCRFYCTHGPGVTVDGQAFTPNPALIVEDFEPVGLGWDQASQIMVEQRRPFAVTLLGIGRNLQVGDAYQAAVLPMTPEDYVAAVSEMPWPSGEYARSAVEVGRSLACGGPAFSAFYRDKLLGVAGVRVLWPGVGEGWAVLTPWGRRYPRHYHRAVREGFREIVRTGGLWRIQALVEAEHWPAIRWAECLGFQPETGRLKAYGPQGQDFVLWAMYPAKEPE